MLTPAQLRAARAILGWSQEQLAQASGVPAVTIRYFETGRTDPKQTTVWKLRLALEAADVEFIGPDKTGWVGVKIRDAVRAPGGAPVQVEPQPKRTRKRKRPA